MLKTRQAVLAAVCVLGLCAFAGAQIALTPENEEAPGGGVTASSERSLSVQGPLVLAGVGGLLLIRRSKAA